MLAYSIKLILYLIAYLPLNCKDKMDVGLSVSLLLNTFSLISPKLLNFNIESYIDRIINRP